MAVQTNLALSADYPRVAGRYLMFEPFARGGMASVHLGRLMGPAGFTRTVAIKRMHEEFAHNPEFVAMFLDEARLAARISHPNVVATLDVVAFKAELLLVMEYVCGESLMGLINKCRDTSRRPPVAIAVDCAIGMLNGLHAAHEAKHGDGRLLSLVHRDVTPHNVLVGLDGVARVVDFGIAKATGTAHRTRVGEIKGKLSYLAPEQIQGDEVSRATDVYAAALVLWETLTCEKLFKGENEGAIIHSVLVHRVTPPSQLRPEIPRALDAIVLRGLDADPSKRWETAKQMAEALEGAVNPVTRSAVAAWVQDTARSILLERQESLAHVESYTAPGALPSIPPPAPSKRLFQVGGGPAPDVSGALGLSKSALRAKLVHPIRQRRRIFLVTGAVAGVFLCVGLLLLRRPSPSGKVPGPRAVVSATVLTKLGTNLSPLPSSTLVAASGTPPISTLAATAAATSNSTVSKPQHERANPVTQRRTRVRPVDPLYKRD